MSKSCPVGIDLFCGAGGLSEGLQSAGIHMVAAVERHPHAALTCAFNHPETTVVCDDIKRIKMSKLERAVYRRIEQATVDIIVGGPPCQGFSPAGSRNPDDPRNKLMDEFVRAVRYFKPRMFLFENVRGFTKMYEGAAFKAIVAKMQRLGYRMHGVSGEKSKSKEAAPLLNSASYGVAQNRTRFVLVGWLPDQLETEFDWPPFTHGEGSSCHQNLVTAMEAIGDLEFLANGRESHVYRSDAVSEYQRARRANCGILFNHLTTKHRDETVRMYRRIKPGATIRSIPPEFRSGKQTMARLHPDACPKTVLALPDDFVHYRKHRIPTVREMARFQSFDDDFVFLGKRTTSDKGRRVDVPQYTQVGNAVPPLLARAVGLSLVRSLGFTPMDLRNSEMRLARHAWIQGSSGYCGYTLSPDADLDLVDGEGNRLPLPFSVAEAPVSKSTRTTNWTRNVRRATVPTLQ